MQKKLRRLYISFILNILMIILASSSLIIEIVNFYTHKDTSIYKNIWGLFRYFTIDGNILSLILNIIVFISQLKAIRMPEGEDIKGIIMNNFLFKISLMAASSELVIFITVVLIFLPFANHEWVMGLVGSYNASSFHITIPILLAFRFIFLDARESDLKWYEKLLGGLPMLTYGIIMLILCGAKVFLSFDPNEGDGKIPYPFLDIYHSKWYYCTFCAIFIFAFGFGIGFLLEYLNKKCEKLILPYDFSSDSQEKVSDLLVNENE